MKRSKLLLALALFYGAFTLLNLAGVPGTLATHDTNYIVQALLGLGIHFGLAVGLFMHKRWVVQLFIVSSVLTIVLSWFWLKANPPPRLFWGTMWVFATTVTLFPGSLMFLRRDRLKVTSPDDVAGVF